MKIIFKSDYLFEISISIIQKWSKPNVRGKLTIGSAITIVILILDRRKNASFYTRI